jgi:hypothetical protein
MKISRDTIEETLQERAGGPRSYGGYAPQQPDEEEEEEEEEEGEEGDSDDESTDDDMGEARARRTAGAAWEKAMQQSRGEAERKDGYSYNSSSFQARAGESESESEDEEDDEDDEDGPHVTTAESAREHVFPILVSELVKESILAPSQGASLMRLFQKGSASITAAMDSYDRDSDMSALVDALTQAVL